jgi:hypothetical protein
VTMCPLFSSLSAEGHLGSLVDLDLLPIYGTKSHKYVKVLLHHHERSPGRGHKSILAWGNHMTDPANSSANERHAFD